MGYSRRFLIKTISNNFYYYIYNIILYINSKYSISPFSVRDVVHHITAICTNCTTVCKKGGKACGV